MNYSVFMNIWYLYIYIFIWHLLLIYSIHGLINWSNVFWTIHTFRYLFYWKYTNPRLSWKKAVRKLLNFVKGNTHIDQKRFYSEMNTGVNGWFWSLSGNKICRWMKPNTQIYIKVNKRIWLWRVIHCICSYTCSKVACCYLPHGSIECTLIFPSSLFTTLAWILNPRLSNL